LKSDGIFNLVHIFAISASDRCALPHFVGIKAPPARRIRAGD
jgi:hypothetical protein